ncbi:MAG TPA: hypothetical protein VLL75_16350 [Vicinamibacteria bacterium]|jgi:hypothetical protein|nr:hypothetical protein [Vicinamibacteria bacterium]
MGPRAARTLLTLGTLAFASIAAAAEMNAHLAPLAPLLGKTWRGTVSPPGAEKPAVDVSRFELALNGQAVRNRHSVDDGAYGGETFILWEEARQSLVYYYFTTAGFYTTGTLRVEGDAILSHEIVKGATDGTSEVKATTRLLPDGRLLVKSRYLKNGQWQDGRETHYVEDPKAVVRFKE